VEGRDVEVQIEAVILYPEVTFQQGRKKENVLGLKFIGKDRVLGLNATNRKTLGKMFTNIAKAWKGQRIVLYVTETQMAGETVKCVRIRNRGSRSATAAEQFLHEDPVRGESRSKKPANGAIDLTGAEEGGESLFGPESSDTADGAGAATESGDGLASVPEDGAPAPTPAEREHEFHMGVQK
jgi:hypothetical protein